MNSCRWAGTWLIAGVLACGGPADGSGASPAQPASVDSAASNPTTTPRVTAAPTLDAIASPTDADPIVVTGNAVHRAVVRVKVDGLTVATTTALASGTFAVNVARPAAGAHAFTATAQSGTKLESQPSSERIVVVEWPRTPAPSVDTIATPTRADPILAMAHGTPGAVARVLVDGGVQQVGAFGADGGFAISLGSAETPDGTHAITVTAQAAHELESVPSEAQSIVVDRTAPPPPVITSPAPGVATAASEEVVVTGEPGGTCVVTVGALAYAAAEGPQGTYTSAAVPLTAAANTITAAIVDAAGNVSPPSLPVLRTRMRTFYAAAGASGSGLTPDDPASLATAKLLARAARGTADVTLVLRDTGGAFDLAETLQLSAEDGGAGGTVHSWRALDGEHPVVRGSMAVAGWTLVDPGRNLYSARLPPNTRSRHLYVAGQLCERARRSVGMETFVTTDGTVWSSRDASLPVFARPQDLDLVFRDPYSPGQGIARTWAEDRLGVVSASRVGDTTSFFMVDVVATGRFVAEPTSPPTWVENALEFLDASTPGQFYLDAGTDTLYYVPRPGEDMATVEARLGILETLVEGDGVADLELHGIEFTETTWQPKQRHLIEAQGGVYVIDEGNGGSYVGVGGDYWGHVLPAAITFRNSQRVVIRAAKVHHVGAEGVVFDVGTIDCVLRDSVITHTGGHAVRVGTAEARDPSTRAVRDVIRANTITYPGRSHASGVGVFVGDSDQSTILYNEIAHLPYTGIAASFWVMQEGGPTGPYRGPWALRIDVGHNVIHDAMKTLRDGGGFYSVGRLGTETEPGEFHDNYVFDIGFHGELWRTDIYSRCLYPDAWTAYIRFRDNVLAQGPGGGTQIWYGGLDDTTALQGVPGSIQASGNWVGASMTVAVNGALPRGVDAPNRLPTDTYDATWPSPALAIVASAGPGADPEAQSDTMAPPLPSSPTRARP